MLELRKQISDTPHVSLLSRLRFDAALYNPAPAHAPLQNGRPCKKGARRPTLQQLLADPQTRWAPLTVVHWYGGETRAVAACMDTAVWYHTGLSQVMLLLILIRDSGEEFEPQALLSTQVPHSPVQILAWSCSDG